MNLTNAAAGAFSTNTVTITDAFGDPPALEMVAISSVKAVGRNALLLHVTGGTVVPRQSDWLVLAVAPDMQRYGGLGAVQTGKFEAAGTSVFFVPSADQQKLFLLRKSLRGGGTELLAVLLKSVQIVPKAGGIGPILAAGGLELERSTERALAQGSAG